MLAAILFDLDGTLLDTSADFLTAINLLLKRQHLRLLSRQELMPLINNSPKALVSKAFNLHPNDPKISLLVENFFETYLQHVADQTRLYLGMQAVLNVIIELKLKWGIVTNKHSRFTNPLIKALQLRPDVVICADQVEKPKPYPHGLLKALQLLNICSQDTLYIGDHLRDIDAARAANITSVAASYGFIDSTDDPKQWQADYTITKAIELIAIIKSLHS